MKVIASIDFNRDDGNQDFDTDDKVVRVSRFQENGEHQVGLSFELGRREDDTLNLTIELGALLIAIAQCEED